MSFLSSIKKRVTATRVKIGSGILGVLIMAVLGGLFLIRASADPVSTPDCTANSVVYCGAADAGTLVSKYNGGDGYNSTASIQNIYNCVGISADAVNNMPNTAVSGYVTNTGDVYADGQLVATGAITGGRHDIGGAASTAHNCNGTTFWERAPQTSFLDPELSAMVVMNNGVFQFAILNSCGNPVVATPLKPNYSIQKQVRVAGTSNYSSDVTAMAGTTVEYKITVNSIGQVPADNITVRDALPSNIAYTSGTLQQDGNKLSGAQQSQFFGNGIVLPTLANGASTTFTFNAVVGPNETYQTCTTATLNNEGYITSPVLPGQQSGASVNKQCPAPPKVTLTCNELTLTPGTPDNEGNVTYTLNASASVQNATITGYTFNYGNGQNKTVSTSATTASTTHTYAPGTYSPSVSVSATANGTNYNETSANCAGKITVATPPQPVIACTELNLTAGTPDAEGNTLYTLVASGSAQNATITGYKFSFGDNSQAQTISTSATSATTTHTYAPGSYTPSVSVLATAYGKSYTVTSANCAGKITIGTPPVAQYTCDELTATPAGDADASGNVAYGFAAAASVQNATITSYTFDFGDGSQTQTVTTGATTAKATHTYAPGSYTAQVTVNVTLADGSVKQVTSAKCSTPITVATPPATCTSPTNGQTYPAGSSECQPAPTCTAPSGQTYPMGSSECTPTPPATPSTPAAPTQLVNTGPGSVIGIFIGAVLAGFIGHKVILKRRARRLATETEVA